MGSFSASLLHSLPEEVPETASEPTTPTPPAPEQTGALPRSRGLSLDQRASQTATASKMGWEKTGIYARSSTGDFADVAPPTEPASVRRWIGERICDPRDICVLEGDLGGAHEVAGRGAREVEDALPGRSLALVVRDCVAAAGRWCSPDLDERKLAYALGLFIEGDGEVAVCVAGHLAAGRTDRAAVVLRGGARGLRRGLAEALGPAACNSESTSASPDAWFLLLAALEALRSLARGVLDAELNAPGLHPHFVEYAVAELIGPDWCAELGGRAASDSDIPKSWIARLPSGVLDGSEVLRLAARADASGGARSAFARALRRGVLRECERVSMPRPGNEEPAADWWVADPTKTWHSPSVTDEARAAPLRYGPPDEEDPFAPAFACDVAHCAGKYCLCGARPARLKRCARCRVVNFCDETCQRKYWRDHAPRCSHFAFLEKESDAPEFFQLLSSGLLNLNAAKPRIAARTNVVLTSLIAAEEKEVSVTASLVGWVRSHCRNGKGQCLLLGLKTKAGVPHVLLDYVLVDADGPSADVDVDERGGEAKGSPAAREASRAEIDKFRSGLVLRGFTVAGVSLGPGILESKTA